MTTSRIWNFLCALLLGLAAAAPLQKARSFHVRKFQHVDAVSGPNQCVVDGNSDLYGLGIRLGVYLQWLTSLIANHHSHEAIRGNLETNTLFLLAIFVAAIVATAQGALESAEILIFLHLCYGSIFSPLSIWGYRIRSQAEGTIRFPVAGSAFRLALITTISVYSVWCWFSGIRRAELDLCPTYTFIFGRVPIGPRVTAFFQVQSVVIVSIFAILFVLEAAVLIWHFVVAILKSMVKARFIGYFSPSKEVKPQRSKIPYRIWLWFFSATTNFWAIVNNDTSGFDRPSLSIFVIPLMNIPLLALRSAFQYICLLLFKTCPPMGFPPLLPMVENNYIALLKIRLSFAIRSRRSSLFFYGVNTACLLWAIFSIELIIWWNHIQGVYTISTTGQLIPFVIGVTSLLSLLQKISVRRSEIAQTEVFMALIDETPKWARKELKSRRSVKCERNDGTLIYTLPNGRRGEFWLRKPLRRHSAPDRVDIVSSSRDGLNAVINAGNEVAKSSNPALVSSTSGYGATNPPVALQQSQSGSRESQMESNTELGRISTNSDPPPDASKPSTKATLIWKLPRFLFNAFTNPLQFLDRVPWISSRAVSARMEFRRLLSEHIDDVFRRAMDKYPSDMANQRDGERLDLQFPQLSILQGLEDVMEAVYGSTQRWSWKIFQTTPTAGNSVHRRQQDATGDDDDKASERSSGLFSRIENVLGLSGVEKALGWSRTMDKLVEPRKQVLSNALRDFERAWKSRSAYAIAMAGLRGLQYLLDTVDPSLFSRSRELCQQSIWAVEDLKRIRKWKRKREITTEMQHILVQDWLEEEAVLKDLVAGPSEDLIAGDLTVLMGHQEQDKERPTVRRYSI